MGIAVGSLQGLWTDPVTGISYARARWYDARTASWLSEDPLQDVDSPNLYSFVAWKPNMGIDPLGLGTLQIGRVELEIPDEWSSWLAQRIGFGVGLTLEGSEQASGLIQAMGEEPYEQYLALGVQELSRAVGIQKRLFGALVSGGPKAFQAEHRAIVGELLGELGEAARGLPIARTVDELVQAATSDSDVGSGIHMGRTFVRAVEDIALVLGIRASLAQMSRVPAAASSRVSRAGVVRRGIYEFPDQQAGGVSYVGQSGDIPHRLGQHQRAGRLQPGTETITAVEGGKTAREIAEHLRIQELTGGVPARQSPNVSNRVDPIGPNRRHLLVKGNE